MAFLATDAEVRWLNIMNSALGIVVLICCLVVVGAIIYEFTVRAKRRAAAIEAVDGDMRALLGVADDHTFNVPGLGTTMADGGEPTTKDRKDKKAH